MELEQMSSAELISLVRRQEQELAAARTALELSHARQLELESPVAQQGGGELPPDERALAERSADLFGVAYLVNGKYVPPELVTVVLPAQRAASVPAQAGQEPLVLLTLGGIEDDEYGDFDMEVISSKAIEQLQAQLVHGRDPVVLELFAAQVPAASVQPEPEAERIAKVLMHMAGNDLIRWNGTGNDDDDAWNTDEEYRATLAAVREGLAAQQPDIGRDAALEENEKFRMHMATISTAALGYCDLSELEGTEFNTPTLRDVVALYEKYEALATQTAPEQKGGM